MNNVAENKSKVMSISQKYERSVVKVHASSMNLNQAQPWAGATSSKGTGSGFVIEGQKIVTNAHVVPNATLILIEMVHLTSKVVAEVHAISYEDDLALLTVADPHFWAQTEALSLDENLDISSELVVVGFPEGGSLNFSHGKITRVLTQDRNSVYGRHKQLVIQTDAAINSGNSGGPSLNANHRVTGVCVSRNVASNQVSFLLPTETLKRFIAEASISNSNTIKSRFAAGIALQPLNNLTLRRELGMQAHQSGVRVSQISPISPLATQLKVNDVILSVDNYTINNDGNFYYDGHLINFNHLYNAKREGTYFDISLLRDKQVHKTNYQFNLPLTNPILMDFIEPNVALSYLIVQGMAFKPFVLFHTRLEGEEGMVYAYHYYHGFKQKAHDQIIVMEQICENELNADYSVSNRVVKEVNGKVIDNMQSLAQAIDENDQPVHRIHDIEGDLYVLENIRDPKQHQDFLRLFNIHSERSQDLISTRNTLNTLSLKPA